MINVFVTHYYCSSSNKGAYFCALHSGTHSKILMKAFRVTNEARVVFHAICDVLDSLTPEKRKMMKVRFFISLHRVWKIIDHKYIFAWAKKGFKPISNESHPDLFQRFVDLKEQFKHVGVRLREVDADKLELCKKNSEDEENLFEDEYWEKHHGILT